jgi:hypothetical protein
LSPTAIAKGKKMTSLTMTRMNGQNSQGTTVSKLGARRDAAFGLRKLFRNTPLSLHPGARGLTLQTVSGLVVVTQAGDLRDYELRPGDEFHTRSRGLVVAWAPAEGTINVMAGVPAELGKQAA